MLVLSACRTTLGIALGVTVIVTDAVAFFGTAQPKLLVIVTEIISPLVNEELV